MLNATLACLSLVLCSNLPGDAAFLAGALAQQDGAHATAQAAFARCAAAEGPFRDFARVRLADLRAGQGDAAGAAGAYRAILRETPPGAWHEMARARLARIFVQQGRRAEAAALFAEALRIQPVSWWLEPLAWEAAENLVRLDPSNADHYAHFREIAATTLFIKTRLDAARMLVRSPAPEDRALAVFAFLRSASYKEAVAALEASGSVIATAGGGETPTPATMQALLSPDLANATARKNTLAALVAANPDNPWIRQWLYYGARTLLNGGRRADAAVLCELLAQHFARSMETGESLWLLAKSLEAGPPARAAATYHKLATGAPEHRLAPWALYHAGRLWLAGGEERRALEAWALLRERHPRHTRTGEAACDAALYFEAKGDANRAAEHYRLAAAVGPGDYFAHRALGRMNSPELAALPNLKVDGRNPLVRPMPPAPGPPPPFPAGFEQIPAVQRLRFFGRHGLEEGEWEAAALCDTFRGHAYEGVVYRMLAEAGYAYTAVQFAEHGGWGLHEGAPTLERRRLDFPLAHWDVVRGAAAEAGIDPYLLLSVARQESTYRPTLVSSAGATGIMQIMPGTGAHIARIEPAVSAQDAARPKYPPSSYRMGAFYLLRMIERSAGNLVYALASYNAGPGNLDKWRRQFPNHGHDAFIDAIPFEETRNYVRRVLGNYAAYYSLYPPPPAP